MPYNEKTADRVREALSHLKKVEEKEMFRGICFMVNGKMCVCVSGDELMCRIGPKIFEESLEKPGVRTMNRNGTVIKGYVYVAEEGFKSKKDFDYWVNTSLAFNSEAKSSKKKASAKKKVKTVSKKMSLSPKKKRGN